MKLSLRHRLFFYFAVIFSLFTIGIALFERSREKVIKTEGLVDRLEIYADLIQEDLSKDSIKYVEDLKKLKTILPPNLRITIINLQGFVQYDNTVDNYISMQGHANRIEIIAASQYGIGSDIRQSASNHHPYLYFAKKYDTHYLRLALPYDIPLKRFLKADNLFLYFLILLFLITLIIIHQITQKFGNSINRLRDFALHSNSSLISFNEDELGEIGKKIAENYHQLEENKKQLSLEKQKLLQHIQISEEGICFISADRHIEFYNNLYIRYLNQLVDDSNSNPNSIFTDNSFSSLHQFLQHSSKNYFETQIKKRGKSFSLRTNIFDDNSFEVILTDITQKEKTKKLKQELTGNIAHELRTPITGIRAYLETVLEHDLLENKKNHFIRQAYYQTLTLSEMIKDMSIIAKMEEAPDSFNIEILNLSAILEDLKSEQADILTQKQIQLDWQLPDKISIHGNLNLVTSVFRNLLENSIRYAGNQIRINISVINEDKDFYYFSFYDTGIGVANESHLNRLFERFYRVQEGRTRETGGSGLGLSIVKNAIHLHKGNISVKNRKEGGLEFIFSLKK